MYRLTDPRAFAEVNSFCTNLGSHLLWPQDKKDTLVAVAPLVVMFIGKSGIRCWTDAEGTIRLLRYFHGQSKCIFLLIV